MLGKFFGSPEGVNQEVLLEFCKLLDFVGVEFDEALRLLLSRFTLPGEA